MFGLSSVRVYDDPAYDTGYGKKKPILHAFSLPCIISGTRQDLKVRALSGRGTVVEEEIQVKVFSPDVECLYVCIPP